MRSNRLVLVPSLAALVLLAAAPDRAAGDVARGVVFHDLDADGRRDAGEPGRPGVLVSDGTRLVQTDDEGRYELPVDDDAVVFVIKPRDWAVPLDDRRLPRFHYVHKPAGSPDGNFLYEGVPPTGPLPASIDFPLVHRPEPDAFDVIVVSDPQPYSIEEVRLYARDVVAELVGIEAAFGVSLGDLVGNDLTLFDPLNEVQALVGVPWHNVYGNHDVNFLAPNDEHSDETFERVYGPTNYAFQHGPVHFVVLDNVIWNGFTGYLEDGVEPDYRNYVGGLHDAQLEFVDALLDHVPADELVVLMMHIPLEGESPHRVPQLDRLLEILSSHPHTFSMSGHTHLQAHWFFGASRGYDPPGGGAHHHYNVGTASGSWWNGTPDERGIPHTIMRDGTPNGYAVVRFHGNRYEIDYHVAHGAEDEHMHVDAPDAAPRGEAVEVFVNVYAGSERSRVRIRAGGGPWIAAQRVETLDPRYVRVHAEEAARDVWLPEPHDCRHLWRAMLPADLPPGVHLVEVRETDMFGRTREARRPITIE